MKRLLFIILVAFSLGLNAQTVLLEKTYKPDSKAKLTNLTELQIDQEKKEIRMFFLTKSTEKRVKAEILYFDLEYNFLRMENIEEDLDRVKEKYGLKMSLNACPEDKMPLLTLEANLSGQAVFKKGYIQRFLNWETGWCEDRFKIEERVKPKGDDGEKLKLVKWWTDRDILNYQRTMTSVKRSYGSVSYNQVRGGATRQLLTDEGNVLLLGMYSSGLKDPNLGQNYTIQKFDASKLEKITETALSFPTKAFPIIIKTLKNGNMAGIFQRMDDKYEYVEFNFNSEIVSRFTTGANGGPLWRITDFEENNGSIYAYGPVYDKVLKETDYGFLSAGSNNYDGNLQAMSAAAKKVSKYQIMKIGSGNIEWVNSSSMEDVTAKLKLPAGEKKLKPYDGRNLKTIGFHVSEINGDIFISGQSFKVGSKGYQYGTVYVFQFDSKGSIKAQHAMGLIEKNEFNLVRPAEVVLTDAKDGKKVYWTVFEIAGDKLGRTLFYPRISQIDMSSLSATAFMNIGEKMYYLDDNFPINPLGNNEFLFLGASRKGKDLWFSKIKFD